MSISILFMTVAGIGLGIGAFAGVQVGGIQAAVNLAGIAIASVAVAMFYFVTSRKV